MLLAWQLFFFVVNFLEAVFVEAPCVVSSVVALGLSWADFLSNSATIASMFNFLSTGCALRYLMVLKRCCTFSLSR